jgi:hypothetical protein
VVRQLFRRVKYRAGGRTVSFMVSLAFMPRLRLFLKLRAYLLNSAHLDGLFVALTLKASPTVFSEQFVSNLAQRLRGLGIEVPKLSARQWRAAKQDWLISNHTPEVAAEALGHSLDTALRAYSNGTESVHRQELSIFFRSVEKTVKGASDRGADEVESAVGSCVDFKQPVPIAPEVPVRPSCKSAEGCLFCDKYRVHADEADIRKLLSCRYCVRITSNRAPSLEEYDQTFGAVLRRIDFLLEELKKRDATLVTNLESAVDVDGELDVFWSSKLEQLLELGVA